MIRGIWVNFSSEIREPPILESVDGLISREPLPASCFMDCTRVIVYPLTVFLRWLQSLIVLICYVICLWVLSSSITLWPLDSIWFLYTWLSSAPSSYIIARKCLSWLGDFTFSRILLLLIMLCFILTFVTGLFGSVYIFRPDSGSPHLSYVGCIPYEKVLNAKLLSLMLRTGEKAA